MLEFDMVIHFGQRLRNALLLLGLLHFGGSRGDFDNTRHGFEFVYHDGTDLGLVIQNNKCYFLLIPDYKEDALGTGAQLRHMEDALIDVILQHDPNQVTRSTLSAMVNNRYHDTDARARCSGKQVYEVIVDVCPVHWTGFGGACYIYVPNQLRHSDASHLCESWGAHLVEITSQAENDFVNRLQNYGAMWLGLDDKLHEGEFVLSSSGQRASYTNWRRGEPNDDYHAQDCVKMARSGQWLDAFCSEELHFVCEKYDQYQWIASTIAFTSIRTTTQPISVTTHSARQCHSEWCVIQNSTWVNHLVG